ncbi:hypothetical protein SRABI128_03037 [Microbacterium sp. Bi128]|nr:hypothetical protein SRABI128_03037 [Microbacterium sp. Bi128]
MEPMPTTIVQKITGAIIILMRLTKPLPRGSRPVANCGAVSPTTMPATTARMTAM